MGNIDLIFDPPFGNCLDTFAAPTWEQGAALGKLQIQVQNRSGDHINIVLECDGTGRKIQTGQIPDGQDGQLVDDIGFWGGVESKITRWRPGFLGAMGNGGGEVRFILPGAATDATIPLKIVS